MTNVLQLDARMGGCPRYYFGNGSSLMYVPDSIPKCVAFVGYKAKSGKCPLIGTAFLVSLDIIERAWVQYYLVTAKHVIDAAANKSADGNVFLRFNSKDGGLTEVSLPCSEWLNHPTDPHVDVAVAVFPLDIDDSTLDHRIIGRENFMTEQVKESHKIGPGLDVFLSGLFHMHAGVKKNIPIVRVGTVAAMPDEKIKTSTAEIDAYLIESRSIGGLSGSPVFVVPHETSQFFLLGLMRGHWDIDASAIDVDEEDAGGGSLKNVNMGIGIVVPAKRILEVLDHPKLIQKREQDAKAWRLEHAPVED